MIYLASATAFKEHLHSLSKDNLNRLQDAGLISPKMISKSVRQINRKLKIPYIKRLHTDTEAGSPYFVPTVRGAIQEAKVAGKPLKQHARGYVNKYGYENMGKISINKTGTRRSLKDISRELKMKPDSSIVPDTIMHEHFEATTPLKNKADYNFKKSNTHNSIDVLLKERKHYYQTGGNFFRNKGFHLQDIRELTLEKPLIDQILPVENIRLSNKDYRLAKKKYYKLVKE